ncbi:VHS1011 protein [Vibrio phage 1]|nr:VHS1011 protein [Vibrio phage 1]
MLKVAKKCCGQCLFSSKRIVSEKRKEDIIAGCEKRDTYFVCHKATINKENVVCRGFYEKHTSQQIRIAQRLGVIDFVEVE